ncbi:MarR family transcriptional regulator [Rhizobium sp. P38BS-XIX]|uniref:MarR family winged helix-turn-helix transcriptional regulator n=1 Tax=Rhizobium sp. P38BS-XIX TaxID=2726740 RepID=UPI0014567E8A|nr:MarR family transcriptional regulator [Rhizobium sp. P38BS-XIX]NLS01107.1 MarR family transcriptional regulator [Rhizobium sp. P38BS-XIX]
MTKSNSAEDDDLAPFASGQLTERSLSYLVRHAHRAFVRRLAEELVPYGLNVAEWAILRVLWGGEGLTQVELAQRMRVHKASLTPTLAALERKQCINRARGDDRRKIHLELTDKGRALEETLIPYGILNNNQALAGINPRDAETARRVLEAIVKNLDGAAAADD